MATIVDDMNAYFGWYGSSWLTDHTADGQTPKYFNSTFHSSVANGDYCIVQWTGTDIAIYGARRDNHGIYGIAIDQEDVQYYSGYSQSNTFQQVLYASSGLAQGDHTIKISNENARDTPQYPNYIWLDIDYVAFTGTMINANAAATNAAPMSSAAAQPTASTVNPPATSNPPVSTASPPSSPAISSTTQSAANQPSPPPSATVSSPPSTASYSTSTSIGQYININSQSTLNVSTTLNAGTSSPLMRTTAGGTKTTGTPDLGSTTSTSSDSVVTAASASDGIGSTDNHKTTVVAVSVTVIVIAAVTIATIGGLWYWRRKKRREEEEKEDADYLAAPQMQSSWR